MAFKDNLLKDLDVFLNTDEFAETVVYTDESGNSKEIPAIFLTKTDLFSEDMNAIESSIPAVLIKRKDLANVKNGDIFTINDIEYTVIQTEYKDDLIIKAYLSRDFRPRFY